MICLTEVMRPGKSGKIPNSKLGDWNVEILEYCGEQLEEGKLKECSSWPYHLLISLFHHSNIPQGNKKMLKFQFAIEKGRPLRVLCLGAHSDDIEIGCGGTILRLLLEHDDVEIYWVVLGSKGKRDGEAIASADKFLANGKKKQIIIKDFKESYFPYIGEEIKAFFEQLKSQDSPDIIFTHYRHDLHQDHRLISDLTWNTFRDHLILEYEVIKYDGDLGSPNLFVHLNETICQKKISLIMDSFKSQANKDWFTPDAFLSILRIRGIESRAPKKYAEGFYCRKLVL
jgi:LmbE family N-acetylglucosaminyl deacetylase